jgi:hypothetical protein
MCVNLQAARASYYEVNHFGADGGDALAWVPIKLGPVIVKIPNTAGRRWAVKFHDVHHVLTGYQTDLAGESEIAAWEVASGCVHLPAAAVLNLTGLVFGAVVWPRRVARAWALGRQTKNLFRANLDELLDRDVNELRDQLGLGRTHAPVRARDVATMIAYIVGAPLIVLGSLLRVIR